MDISHCEKHGTQALPDEPCWGCYNEGYDAAKQEHLRYAHAVQECLSLLASGRYAEAAVQAYKELVFQAEEPKDA